MGKKSAPPPPDYRGLALEQAAASKDTAQYNAQLNRVNQVTPDGSLTWSSTMGPDGQPVWTQTTSLSPEQQALYNQQNKLSQQYLNTAQSAVDRVSNVMGQGLDLSGVPGIQYMQGNAGTSAQVNTPYRDVGSGPQFAMAQGGPAMQNITGTPSLGGVGQAPGAQMVAGPQAGQTVGSPTAMQTVGSGPGFQGVAGAQGMERVSGSPQFQTSLGQIAGPLPSAPQLASASAGGIRGSFDTSGVRALPGNIDDASRRRVEEAIMSRLNPQYQNDEQALRTRLLNSGIEVGTDAYNREMNNFSQRLNDARMQAVLAGGQEESRQVGLQAGLQGQEFNQAYQRGVFGQNADIASANNALQAASINNQAALAGYNAQLAGQAQQFGQGLAAANFGNNWQQQGFNNQLQAAGVNNAAAQQDFTNQLSAAGFNNTATQQGYQNQLSAAGFNNSANQSDFNNQMSAAGFNNNVGNTAFTQGLAATQANNAALNQNYANQLAGQGFNNQAAQQGFTNNMSAAGFNNTAAQQQYQNYLTALQANNASGQQQFQNAMAGAGFANDAARSATQQQMQIDQLTAALQQQQTGFNNSAAQNAIQLQAYLRQLPLNEANALRTGGQVQGPQFGSYYTGAQAQGPQLLDAGIAQGNYNMQAAQQNQSGFNAFLGGMAQLGAAQLGKPSDPRLKSNIVRVGTHHLGIGVYEYDIAGRRERGVMSTEVRAVAPHAVNVGPDGFDRVRYDLIGGL